MNQQKRQQIAVLVLCAIGLAVFVLAAIAFIKSQAYSRSLAKERDARAVSADQLAFNQANAERVQKNFPTSIMLNIGDRVVLRHPSEVSVMLCPTSEDWAEASTRSARKDDDGFRKLIQEGRLFFPPNDTTAKVIRGGVEAYEVRITDGPLTGKSGWVLKAHVHREK